MNEWIALQRLLVYLHERCTLNEGRASERYKYDRQNIDKYKVFHFSGFH
jgi:hypothetical protein